VWHIFGTQQNRAIKVPRGRLPHASLPPPARGLPFGHDNKTLSFSGFGSAADIVIGADGGFQTLNAPMRHLING
jgi:hypothetical protein